MNCQARCRQFAGVALYVAAFSLAVLALALAPAPAMGQQPTNFGSASGVSCPNGNVICNGSINFLTTELFFEPETPPQSLKGAPTNWNELEQLLDNPYLYTWGAACNDGKGLVPGTEQGYPTYCTPRTTLTGPVGGTFFRRPTTVDNQGRFSVSTLPPMLLHPLNYNPQTAFGVEMRILNPDYQGTRFQVGGTVPDPFSPGGVSSTGMCYIVGASCTPATQFIDVTSGASRGLEVGTATAPGETVIDMNVGIGRQLGFCQTNPEPVPITGTFGSTSTAFDSENLTVCGADPGEPGAASIAHNNTILLLCASEVFGASSLAGYLCEDNQGLPRIGQATTSSYSISAVPAPNLGLAMLMQIPNGAVTTGPAVNQGAGVAGTGTGVILNPALGFRLRDPARGGVINPYDPTTGIGGLHKPSLAKAEFGGGTGLAPNYLWNSLDPAHNGGRPDPLGADLQPSNENDYVGLFGTATGANATATFYLRKQAARLEAMVLGKSLFWDQQVGSDGVQACGSCHAHAAADNRTKNQVNPFGQDGISGAPTFYNTDPTNPAAFTFAPNYDLQRSDFPFLKLTDPDVAGDPLCTPAITADVTGFTFPDGDPLDNPKGNVLNLVFKDNRVCDASNKISDTDDVASSMGVHFGRFYDIPNGVGLGLGAGTTAFGSFATGSAIGNVKALVRDKRSPIPADNIDPIAGFAGTPNPDGSANQFRRVEPRNTPTIFLADMNFDNFWDGRARHDDNGGSVFGPSDPQAHVYVNNTGTLVPTRQLIKFSSLGSLAKGPALSKFEMSFDGRNWSKIGKKFLQPGVTPLANQLVDPTDGILGRYSNQGGSACATLPIDERSGSYSNPPVNVLNSGKPGLCISYAGLIRHAFNSALWNGSGAPQAPGTVASQHLDGCYTDGAPIHTAGDPNAGPTDKQCSGLPPIPILEHPSPGVDVFNDTTNYGDPFDGYRLTISPGVASPTDTNQFTQMEANFSLFWGQSIHLWATILVPDDTPDDKFLDANPDTGANMGETGEPLLVLDLPNCPNPAGYNRGYFIGSDGFLQYRGSCFTEVGNFKRDPYNPNDIVFFQNDTVGHPRMTACINQLLDAGGIRRCTQRVAAGGTRGPGTPDPLLGFDIFFGSNVSLKNPNFRSARCGACHNAPALTDNTVPFTVKGQELDNFGEFEKGNPTLEPLTEPAVRERVISGFLLESEINEPGQDAIERKAGNLGIAPAPVVANGNCITDNCSGYVFPDAITANVGPDGTYSNATGYVIHADLGSGPVAGGDGVNGVGVPFTSFGGSFIDNGVYNIGVRPCVADQSHVTGACEDTGRGGTDAFGWPLSLAALMMKNFGGPAQQPGTPIPQFDPNNPGAREALLTNADVPACAPYCSTGGLLQLTAQDQRINPGYEDQHADPQLPPYLAPFANRITVGDEHPESDEACGPVGGCINTLMDVANEEGFPELPFNARAATVEVTNAAVASGDADVGLTGAGCGVGGGTAPCSAGVTSPITHHGSAQMGTWPVVNRVGRFGNIKAPQLREVELTGPYFHNGGKLTLRQVVDFYVRGGDFPVTNSNHRDFNILNLNAELQSDLSEEEKVALVDYMLEFTDDRVALEKSPFDHPQLILPLDGTAPESDGTINRDVMLSGCVTADNLANQFRFGPGQQACDSGLFLNVPATGAAGNPGGRIPNFLGIAGAAPDAGNPGGRQRLVGPAAFCGSNITSQYCH
jgi:cytochrome c peroxidase